MIDDYLVFETRGFHATQCRDCPLPGYLIVQPNMPVTRFTDLTPQTWHDLTAALLLACRIVETVVQPQRLYVCRFGEETATIHFHVFPRTRWLLEACQQAGGPTGESVSGPRLFDWARATFHPEGTLTVPGPGVADTLRRLREVAAHAAAT